MKAWGILKAAWLVMLVLLSYAFVYSQGIERGYWEHEAEENVYECDVI
jgi:hypothetical protein